MVVLAGRPEFQHGESSDEERLMNQSVGDNSTEKSKADASLWGRKAECRVLNVEWVWTRGGGCFAVDEEGKLAVCHEMCARKPAPDSGSEV